MRSFAAATLLLAACATVPDEPSERVAGCWIERSDRGAVTMRWLADPSRPDVLVGEYLTYPTSGTQMARTYTLTRAEPWTFCHVPAGGDQRCWQVAQGSSGSLEGGRVFIDVHRERLRIAIADGSIERVVFQGERDGCD
jgi:hypothetical protein